MQVQMPTVEKVVVAAVSTPIHDPEFWSRVEAYAHEGACKRFVETHGVSVEYAYRIFLEMKRFLYISIMCRQSCSPSKVIDSMWHEFLVHTADYRSFCQEFSRNGFIDHNPSGKPETENYVRTRELVLGLFGTLDEEMWPDASHASAASDCEGPCCVGGCVPTVTATLQ